MWTTMFKRLGRHAVRLSDKLWYDDGSVAMLSRTVLLPLEIIYRAVNGTRDHLYNTGVLRSREAALPCISIGNLSVGGSGKTPVAAWFASRLAARGTHPAIVMRGYGSDEILVHEQLNPSIPVIADPDRLKGVREAVAQGADIVVLDDAFQHRAIKRTEDIVLVNADRLSATERAMRQHLLPAGPWREPFSALRRASLVIITSKVADPLRISKLESLLSRFAPSVKVAVMYLLPDKLLLATGNETRQIQSLEGARVLAVTSIADPESFHRQLTDAGAAVTGWAYPDHYDFTRADAESIAAESRRYDMAICTLKDAVKLGPLWPAVAPKLWYVKQRIEVESGSEHLDSMIVRLTDRTLRLI